MSGNVNYPLPADLARAPSVSMRRRDLLGTAAALCALASGGRAVAQTQAVRVAAASDLQFALAELAATFQKISGVPVALSLGSSGNFARQIRQGLPVDLFMSADEAFVFALADAGLTLDRGAPYALGRIALFAAHGSPVTLDARLEGVRQGWDKVSKFAIANPEHAPYGRAAQQALVALGMWEMVRSRLVLAENVSQAAQFVSTGAAQAGITALSLVLAPPVAERGRHVVLAESLHAPLRQRMVLLKDARGTARAFCDFLQSAPARAVLQRYGFSLP